MSTETAKGEEEKDETKKKRSLDSQIEPMLLPSLYRLTDGVPRRELKMMVAEAKACEEALEREIKQLQQGLDEKKCVEIKELKFFVDMVLDSEVTPADSFFTVSALLGRLRDDLTMPLPPNSSLPAHRAQLGLLQQPPKKKKKEANDAAKNNNNQTATITTDTDVSTTLEKQKQILGLQQNPEYIKEHAVNTTLLALWKKISNHRASIVFRRPVNPKEAPGYTDRIAFPMDLSLVRKMIVGRMINSYAELHRRIGLICHNCMKYNGRDSDYGVVTREFEANAEEFIIHAVAAATALTEATKAADKTAAPTEKVEPANAKSTSPTPPAAQPTTLPANPITQTKEGTRDQNADANASATTTKEKDNLATNNNKTAT
jgi:hypothetical protein